MMILCPPPPPPFVRNLVSGHNRSKLPLACQMLIKKDCLILLDECSLANCCCFMCRSVTNFSPSFSSQKLSATTSSKSSEVAETTSVNTETPFHGESDRTGLHTALATPIPVSVSPTTSSVTYNKHVQSAAPKRKLGKKSEDLSTCMSDKTFLETVLSETDKSEVRDESYHFCLNVAATLRSLPERQRELRKLEIQQLLYRSKYATYSDAPNYLMSQQTNSNPWSASTPMPFSSLLHANDTPFVIQLQSAPFSFTSQSLSSIPHTPQQQQNVVNEGFVTTACSSETQSCSPTGEPQRMQVKSQREGEDSCGSEISYLSP